MPQFLCCIPSNVNSAPQTGETVCFAEFTPDFAAFARTLAVFMLYQECKRGFENEKGKYN